MPSRSGRVAVVTGGASGMGEAICHELGRRGHRVAVLDLNADAAARVAGELVQPQEGDFYGGWITSDLVGPFKGGPGTMGW